MPPWIAVIFALGIGLSALAAWETQRSNARLTQQALAVELQETADAVERRMHRYQFGLRGIRGAIQAVEAQQLTLAAFQRYSDTRDIGQEFPGARAFGYIVRVPLAEHAAFVAQQQQQGRSDFQIKQLHAHSGERYVIQYISPLAGNEAGIGLDIASEPGRQAAAVEALHTGEVRLTRPIVLVQSTAQGVKAFLMVLPVYRSSRTPANGAEREAQGIGWSYAALEIDQVLSDLGVYNTGLGLQLFDVTEDRHPLPFFDGPNVGSGASAVASLAIEREIFGRQWRLQMLAYPAFVATLNQTSPRLVLVLGLLISGLVAALLAVLDNLRRRRMEIFTDQARLAAIVESSSDGIVGKDLSGIVTSWNQGAEHIFGFTAAQAVGKRLAELVVPDDLQAEERDILARINRGERVDPFETQRRHRDGHLVDVSVAVAPIRDGAGQIVGASKTVRDISAQKAAEMNLQVLYSNLETQVAERTAELQQAKLQADSANAAKSSFLANMSHEIRTPLNAVLGMLQLLLHTSLNSRQNDYVNKARSAAQSLLDLLNDILDFSKIEAGKLQLDLHRFELETLMRSLAVVLSGNQGDKEVEVVFDLSPTLPSVLIGDRLRLQQVLINLAGNALKFTPKGYVIVSVTELERDHDGVKLRIAVTDTGIGIAKDHQQHIFEGFAQAEASTTRRFGGSGLGLVICRRLVELMGGELQVISAPNQGSRFWFDLRFAVEPGKTLGADCQNVERPLNILIADDNTVVAELMRHTIEGLGWHADLVTNGLEAVARVREVQHTQPYDVVLMDWRMPELDGLSAAQQIHDDGATQQQPVVVMLTAYGREALAHIQQIAHSPFIDFLTKPVTPQQLAATVKQALQGGAGNTPEQDGQQPAQPRLAGLRLLVVEDNALNRMIAAELLGYEGAQVQLAEGGLQGVGLATSTPPAFDLVIMDVQMPDIDGYEATRRIRQQLSAAQLPILAMTANASLTDRQLCLAAGMNDHVGKPIDIDQVVEAVLRLTGRSSASGAVVGAQPESITGDQLVEDGGSILSRFGMNIDLLQRLYVDFQQDAHVLLARLQAHIDHADEGAQRLALHSLKGSAASLGAKALALRAGELEQQLKQQPEQAQQLLADPRTLQQLHELLANSVAQLGSWIATCAPQAPTAKAEATAMSADSWQRQCAELSALLAAGNMRALELCDAMAASNPPPWFAEVATHVNALRFVEASQRLSERPE
ncbi:MAG: CHASE domain-containing protein [Pseudomonas sp.]|uniref:CHASE domain-containing protein n=1 Tax=Pseudomonas sp. TaxID=306 RepID=UPI0030F11B56